MKAIIYISESVKHFHSEELLVLSNKAAEHNAKTGITGYLWYEKGHFLQYIEGDNLLLDALMLKIENDNRHTILHRLDTIDISEIKFPSWHMKYFHSDQMIEITHEKILTDQLLFLKSTSINDPKLIDSIWRLTDSLAKYNR